MRVNVITKRLKSFLLRWRVLVPAVAILTPITLGFVLGLFWLREHGLLLAYSIACAAVGLLVYLALKLPIWVGKNDAKPELSPEDGHHIEADPDWTNSERRAFAAAQAVINARLTNPLPPEEIQSFALEIVTTVANASGRGGKQPLDFTIPEALLLIERVSSRLRSDLRTHISISDRISVKMLLWLWENQSRAKQIYKLSHGAYRVYRLTVGLPVALARELLELVTDGNSKVLTGEMLAVGQRILFEEVAKASTELYSGRLRMSDAEILDSILEDTDLDRKRLAAPDAPIRIAVAGQVSAGKSTLINVLLGREAAETDMPPTTDRVTAHEGEIAGVACTLIDLPGLDGSKTATDATTQEAENCDILVWVLPANRPGRELDRATIDAIKAAFRAMPERRAPPIIGAATFCDKMAGNGWPFPEHEMPLDIRKRIGDAMIAIASEVAIDSPIPIALGAVEWNVDTLRQHIASRIAVGMSVQRNRIRLARRDKSVGREAIDTMHGLQWSLKKIGQQAAARYRGSG